MNQDLTAFVGSWGVSYAANLTPHDTGMGTWTFQQFKRAMVEG
ncbi:diheme cytochrome c-553, partial [Salegentibacter sp. F63223]|nr:diheme cytochrome c-553 [Salegentibacter maritimus]